MAKARGFHLVNSMNLYKAFLALGIEYVDDLTWDHMQELSKFAEVKVLEELFSWLKKYTLQAFFVLKHQIL